MTETRITKAALGIALAVAGAGCTSKPNSEPKSSVESNLDADRSVREHREAIARRDEKERHERDAEVRKLASPEAIASHDAGPKETDAIDSLKVGMSPLDVGYALVGWNKRSGSDFFAEYDRGCRTMYAEFDDDDHRLARWDILAIRQDADSVFPAPKEHPQFQVPIDPELRRNEDKIRKLASPEAIASHDMGPRPNAPDSLKFGMSSMSVYYALVGWQQVKEEKLSARYVRGNRVVRANFEDGCLDGWVVWNVQTKPSIILSD